MSEEKEPSEASELVFFSPLIQALTFFGAIFMLKAVLDLGFNMDVGKAYK